LRKLLYLCLEITDFADKLKLVQLLIDCLIDPLIFFMNNCLTQENHQILSQFLVETMEHFNLTAKQLSQVSGISENHISDFRRSRNKTGVSTKVLWSLIEGMEQIAPGARQYFCSLMGGLNPKQFQSNQSSFSCSEIIRVLEADELAMALSDNLELLLKAIPHLNNEEQADIMTALAQCLRSETPKFDFQTTVIHNNLGHNFGIFKGTFQSCG